ncbi:tyrosine-type recombinase/integrase [Streptomyces sp. SID8381]|uniref:tyrosine-type recombinase/integrase n=1 Tax=unclassified Streptomyces TaxID=2593676 RepID=UPI000363F54E|nr:MULTISPECIES: site-specific integrase [unclassified Streptomyces]MYX31480.1 tyrosine-type recombinase/integrase [Streptomyces sp. SID8381]
MAQTQKPQKSRQPNGASSIFFGKDGRWHGYVTVGVKDDGSPDRRHISRKTRPEVTKAVRDLEKKRDSTGVAKIGQTWTVKTWLTHWVENIAAPSVSENTIDGYRVAVYHHLIPGLGAHRLEKLEPEHLERFYRKMQANGSAAGTAHQAHRTVRTALNEAVRRKHLTANPASIAKAPKIEEEEVEPYTLEEVQRLLLEAGKHRNTARWVIALALGLRQGEVLGLKWEDVDFEAGVILVRRGRLRPRYQHGCGDKCGRKPGYCPQKINVRRETKDTKTRAGKRPIGVPEELLKLLRLHKEQQERERMRARDLWVEKGYVFTSPTGEPLNPNTDFHRWKDLLKAAKVRDGRLHDARHTAATVLLILGVPDAVVDRIMGWEPGKSARMRRRYQHLTSPVLQQTAAKVGGLLWGAAQPIRTPEGGSMPAPSRGPVPSQATVYVACLGERRVPFVHREHAESLVSRWGSDRPGHPVGVEEWARQRWESEGAGGLAALRERMPDRSIVHHAHAVFLPGGVRLNTGSDGQWSVPAWEFETDLYTDLPVRWHTTRRPGQEVEAQVRGTDREAVAAAFGDACAQAVDRAMNPEKYGDTSDDF